MASWPATRRCSSTSSISRNKAIGCATRRSARRPGNPYALVTISSPANLKRLDRLIEINRRLADPRKTTEADAAALASEGRPFYLLYATIHSTEVGNGQSILLIGHKLATASTPAIREILDNAVLLMVPSQNPGRSVSRRRSLVPGKAPPFARVFPDLYRKYAGHDDNRDWFMFTQKETRLNVEKVQNVYKPRHPGSCRSGTAQSRHPSLNRGVHK